MVERQERTPVRNDGKGRVRERLAQLPSQVNAEVRVGVSPQDPYRPGELAEPVGGVEEDVRTDLPGELGQVTADLLVAKRRYPVAGQAAVEGTAGEHPEGEWPVPHR